MSTCQIKTCRNNYRKAEFRNIHFYRFPKEEALILKWKAVCGKENVNVKNGRICSIHFDLAAYKEPSWMQSLLGYSLSTKRKLKFDAVPTLNLGLSISEATVSHFTTRQTQHTQYKINNVFILSDRNEFRIMPEIVINTIEEQMETLTSLNVGK